MTDWITALTALGALIAAVWAGLTSKRLYEIEAKRDVVSDERRARQQAAGIAAWCVFCPESERRGLLLHNSSDAPVFDVEVLSTYAPSQKASPVMQRPLVLTLLPPGDYVADEHPTFGWTFPDERVAVPGTVRPVTKNSGWMVTAVRFTDAHGIRWERKGGLLSRLPLSIG